MKILKNGKFASLVWMKKGESFPACTMPQKQGFYLLWTGVNLSDFRKSEYLGAKAQDISRLDF